MGSMVRHLYSDLSSQVCYLCNLRKLLYLFETQFLPLLTSSLSFLLPSFLLSVLCLSYYKMKMKIIMWCYLEKNVIKSEKNHTQLILLNFSHLYWARYLGKIAFVILFIDGLLCINHLSRPIVSVTPSLNYLALSLFFFGNFNTFFVLWIYSYLHLCNLLFFKKYNFLKIILIYGYLFISCLITHF